MPSARMTSAAAAANRITSPCVIFATVGTTLPTRASLSVVSATSETRTSCPSPTSLMSYAKPNLPKRRHFISCESTAGVSASSLKGMPWSSQYESASRESARKTLPFDQLTAFGREPRSFSTVVPLPVPERPCSTSTQPRVGASPSAPTISAATASALLPSTSSLRTFSTGGFAARTPLATAIAMPAVSLSASSASRARMSSISRLANAAKTASVSNAAMIASDDVSSLCSSSASESGDG
mmetsp:Transcript_37924/g.104678  ORF Transcript_37924/g.104678 Transcript_37924/m.104678 type:complete len:240 (+) Transcript_37924:513-1232(+)